MTGLAHGEAEAILTDRGAGVDDDAVADQRVGQGGIGSNIAVLTDMHAVADNRAGRRAGRRPRRAVRVATRRIGVG